MNPKFNVIRGLQLPKLRIDRILAHHYGITDEELYLIINYDIKYRMGRDGKSKK